MARQKAMHRDAEALVKEAEQQLEHAEHELEAARKISNAQRQKAAMDEALIKVQRARHHLRDARAWRLKEPDHDTE